MNLKKKSGNSLGDFKIPTSLGKVEVSLLAAAIESVTKIGHCSGKIKITKIKDEREEKRKLILIRAEELLKELREELPQTDKISETILDNTKKNQIVNFSGEIFGGPKVKESDEIILVEGRADVLNLLRFGILNALCFNGSSIPKEIKTLTKNKIVTAFLDDDYAGKHLLEELKSKINLDYYCFAPDSKEVEDLNIKEIQKSLKNKKKLENQTKTQKTSKKTEEKSKNSEKLEKTEKQEKIIKKRSYFLKKEFDLIFNIVKELKEENKKEIIILDEKLNKNIFQNTEEFFKSETNGRFLIFDGICEGTIIKKAKILNFDLIVCKSKSQNKSEDIDIILFEDILKED